MLTLFRRIASLLRWRRMADDLSEELRFHRDMTQSELEREGRPPAQAAVEAGRAMGNTLLAREDARGVWIWPWLEDLARDLRGAARNLRRAPGFALVTVSTLALGIGANTAIFSLVNAALLRPLPYPDPERLVAGFSVNPSQPEDLWSVAPADYRDWREQATTMASLAAYSGGGLSVWLGERPESVPGERVTFNFFDTLGVPPLIGRGFQQEDEQGPAIVVLSHRFWQDRLGADPAVVGAPLRTADGPVTVVGVMPPGFAFPDYAEMWTLMGPGESDRRAVRYWRVVGRLNEGASLEAAQAEIAAVADRLGEQYPTENGGWSARILPFGRALVTDVRQPLWMLMGAAGFVILVACANVAGLGLARAAARRREMHVRLALGATRGRLARQLLAEGVLVSLLGAAGGLGVARLGTGAFFGLLPDTSWTSLVRFRDGIDLDVTVLLFTVGIAVATAILLTLVPAWEAPRLAPAEAVRTAKSRTGTRREHGIYKTLVVAQVSCAIVLLTGAGLLTRSFVRMLDVDHGYDPRGLVTLTLPLPFQSWQAFIGEGLERVQAAPAVESAAVMSFDRFGQLNFPFNIEDTPLPGGDVLVRYSAVAGEYFGVLRSTVLAGRVFDARDAAGTPGVAVINDTLARRFFPETDPVGRTIVLAYDNQRIPRRVIGVVSDVRQDGPAEPIKPEILVPWAQLPWLGGVLVMRAHGDASAAAKQAQEALWAFDSNLPVSRVQTLEEVLSAQVATNRLYMILLGSFSVVALVLVVLGIYGLLAHVVGRRRHEMAIRLAVGAGRPRLIGLVLGQALRLSAAGIAIGLAGAVVVTRTMQSLLFEVTPTDPVTLAGVALLLVGVASAAGYLPARRAANTDPVVVLRQE